MASGRLVDVSVGVGVGGRCNGFGVLGVHNDEATSTTSRRGSWTTAERGNDSPLVSQAVVPDVVLVCPCLFRPAPIFESPRTRAPKPYFRVLGSSSATCSLRRLASALISKSGKQDGELVVMRVLEAEMLNALLAVCRVSTSPSTMSRRA